MDLIITSVLNQVVYPKAGDVDDCWVVATIQAMHAFDPERRLPDVTEFRAAAADADDGRSDGGSLSEIILACSTLWPDIHADIARAMPWATFSTLMKQRPRAASIAVNSRYLPRNYNFFGMHQVCLFVQDGVWRIANPLAPNGSLPATISEADLKSAVLHYSADGAYGVIFPSREDPMLEFDIVGRFDGSVTFKGDHHSIVGLADRRFSPAPDGYVRNAFALIKLKAPLNEGNGDRQIGYLVTLDGDPFFALAVDVVPTETQTFTAAEVAAKVAAATRPATDKGYNAGLEQATSSLIALPRRTVA